MIPGILKLNSKTKYGLTSRNVPLYLFRPLDVLLQPCIVGCSAKNLSTNLLGLVNVEKWEEKKLTRGHLVKIIGECGNREAEEEALVLKHSKIKWKKNVVLEQKKTTHRFVDGYTFHVDPLGCKDIDDAITIGEDGFVYIVIADVSAVITPELFEKASKIGQTLYKNGSVVSPLLPIQAECSLDIGRKRKAIALKFKWETQKISIVGFEKVEIINQESFTYESIYASKYSSFLKELSKTIMGKYSEDSKEWIASLMMFYNFEVAKHLLKHQKGLLRVQDEPSSEKVEMYANILDLEFMANKAASYACVSTQKTHWTLQTHYCHATSPIRRFADIVNQFALFNEHTPSFSIELLNQLEQDAKMFERDMFFLQKLLCSDARKVEAIALNDHRIWVPEWKRLITCKHSYKKGTKGILKYSLNMNEDSWKKRMVFRFEDTNYQE
jgi:exoribonuclease R